MHCIRVRKSQLFFLFNFRFRNYFFFNSHIFFLISNSKFEIVIRIQNLKCSKSLNSMNKHLKTKCPVRFPEQVKADGSAGVVMSVQMVAAPAAAAEPEVDNDDSSSEDEEIKLNKKKKKETLTKEEDEIDCGVTNHGKTWCRSCLRAKGRCHLHRLGQQ
jgi:hypothetical protein